MNEHDIAEVAFNNGYEKGYADAKPKWISVKERLPERNEWVLTYYEDGMQRVKKYDIDGFPILLTIGLEWVSVTHWMPLPEPPKGE